MGSIELSTFNQSLFKAYDDYPQKNMLTFPYLGTPTDEYWSALTKVVVMNRETNGWGEKEFKEGKLQSFDDLIDLYITKININRENLGSIWPMYNAFRDLSEEGKVGFFHSNVALIGKPYNQKGFDQSIKVLLVEYLNKLVKLLEVDVLLLGIGFGTKTRTEDPYLELLESTFLGELEKREELEDCPGLYKLKFKNQGDIWIYGYGHPQGLAYKPIVDKIKYILKERLNSYT